MNAIEYDSSEEFVSTAVKNYTVKGAVGGEFYSPPFSSFSFLGCGFESYFVPWFSFSVLFLSNRSSSVFFSLHWMECRERGQRGQENQTNKNPHRHIQKSRQPLLAARLWVGTRSTCFQA